MKFRHFVANADFGNLNVAVYGEDSGVRILKVHNSRTQKEYAATHISKKKYAEMREEWGMGLSSPDNDVNLTKRAIDWVNAQPKNHPNRRKPRDGFSPEALKKLRAGAGWTQAECAAEIHSTRRTLQDWENGVSAMHPGLWELLHIKAKRRRKITAQPAPTERAPLDTHDTYELRQSSSATP